MLTLDDKRWGDFDGGYREKYDASVALSRLECGDVEAEKVWEELWENLHHQGDIGVASYAVVPQLARIIRLRKIFDYNPFALVVVIEQARHKNENPEIPDWLKEDYSKSLHDIAQYGIENMNKKWDAETLKAILSLISILQGQIDLSEMISEIEINDAKGILEKYFEG